MKRKSLLIVASVVVVAVIAVVACYFAGVFGNKNQQTNLADGKDIELTLDAAKGSTGPAYYNVGTDFSFDVKSIADLTQSAILNSTVAIESNYPAVAIKAEKKDEGLYTISAKNGFTEYASYKVELNGATFAEDEAATSLVFKIVGAEKEVAEVSENVVALSNGTINTDGDEITVDGANAYTAGTIIELDGSYFKVANVSGNTLQVEVPAASEVFDKLDVHVVDRQIELKEGDITIDEEAITAQVLESEYVENLISLISKKFDIVKTDAVKVAVDFTFEKGELLLTFNIKIAIPKVGDITVIINNRYAVTYSADYSLSPLSVAVDAQLVGTSEISVQFGAQFEMKYHKDLVDFEKQLVECKGKLLDTLSTKICKLSTPIGTTPLLFIFQLDFDTQIGVYGNISANVGFDVKVECGLTYVKGEDIEKYANFEGKVSDAGLRMFGKVGATADLTATVGISLANLADASIGAGVGVYGEVYGAFEYDFLEKDLMAGYYSEVGLYIPIKAKVNVVGILKNKTFTLKEWKIPFVKLGAQYIPNKLADDVKSEYVIDKELQIEDVMAIEAFDLKLVCNKDNKSYFVTNKKISAKDFKYEYDKNYLNIDKDGKITLAATAPSYFGELYGNKQKVVATSKYNNAVSYEFYVTKNPTVPTTLAASKDYDKKLGTGISYTVYLNGTSFTEIKDVAANAYTIVNNNGELTITFSAAYVGELNIGANNFVVVCSKDGSACELKLTANVIDTTPATLDGDASADFVIGSAKSALFKFNLYGSKFISISDAEGELDATSYSVSNYTGNLKIFENYFANKTVGAYTFTVATTYGELEVSVNLVDNRAPVIDTAAYVYNKVWATDLKVAVTLYSAKISAVKANNVAATYTATDDGIILPASYLADLGNYTAFVIVTDKGNLEFSVTMDSSAAFLVLSKTATVDLNKLGDAVYNFISTDKDATISGNNIKAADFAIVGDECNYVATIKSAYIATLAVGEYKYTLKCGDNSALFTLIVKDSKVSTIGDSEFSFDKAAPKAIDFAIALANSDSIKSVIGYGIEASDYTIVNGKVTIAKAYLESLNIGSYSFEIETAAGAVMEIAIAVNDTRVPTASDIATYDKTARNTVDFTIKLFGHSFSNIAGLVEGSDYLVSFNGDEVTITFQESYLNGLEAGNYDIVANTTGGKINKNLNIVD